MKMSKAFVSHQAAVNRSRTAWHCAAVAALVIGLAITPALAQGCYTAADMAGSPALAQTRQAIENAATQYFQMAQQGNSTALQQNAEFQLGDVVNNNKDVFAGQAGVRNTYLLDNSQGGRAEFICGIANSRNRVGFMFGNLPAGQYGIVIQDVNGGKGGRVNWILHQSGGQWKIAGIYPKPGQLAGHDANWYLDQARSYKSHNQLYNAWLYYLIANDLVRPFPAMSTDGLDRLSDEIQETKPKELPSASNPVVLAVSGRTVNLTDLFALPVGDNLDLIVKYQTPDISDSTKAFQENIAVIKALVARYPEFRQAFAAVVARAVAPNGLDYGTPLAMKEVK